jgi:hypothetical protein
MGNKNDIVYRPILGNHLFSNNHQGERGGQGMRHAWERREKCTRFWWESPKERDDSEDRGIDGRIGLEWILGRLVGAGGVEWIHLAQDRDRWWAVVNAVMNLRILAKRS